MATANVEIKMIETKAVVLTLSEYEAQAMFCIIAEASIRDTQNAMEIRGYTYDESTDVSMEIYEALNQAIKKF